MFKLLSTLNRKDLCALSNKESFALLIECIATLKEFNYIGKYMPVDDGFFYLLMQLTIDLNARNYTDAVVTLSALQNKYSLHNKHIVDMVYYTLSRYLGGNNV